MTRTPVSLLVRLRDRSDRLAWVRFVDLYGPLLYEWLHRRFRLQHHDATEVSQEVLLAVVQEMPTFRYDPGSGSFRRWLYGVMKNRLLGFWRQRGRGPLAIGDEELQRRIEELESSADATVWAEEHDSHVVRRVLALLKADFAPATWQAFLGSRRRRTEAGRGGPHHGDERQRSSPGEVSRTQTTARGNGRFAGLRAYPKTGTGSESSRCLSPFWDRL